MIRLNDRWFRLVGIPLIALLGDWIFYDELTANMVRLSGSTT